MASKQTAGLLRLAGPALAEAHLEHPEEADHGIEGIVPLREAVLNLLSETVLKHDALGISPLTGECAELFPVVPVALAAERVLALDGETHARIGMENPNHAGGAQVAM
ncbi:MAG: hypothetical protein ACLQOO_29770 [Terriglobia bacterium]